MIYVDELLLVNFVAAAALLLGAGLLSGRGCSWWRLVAGAGGAALSALLLLAPELPFGPALACKALSGGAVVGLAYGWHGLRRFGQVLVWYLLLNLAATGAVLLWLSRAVVPGLHSNNLAVYLDVSPGLLLGCIGAVYGVLRGLTALFGRPEQQVYAARLLLQGAEIPVQVFADTGFRLMDPVGGRTVVLVRYPAVRMALPAALRQVLDGALGQGSSAALPEPAMGLRFVDCSTVTGHSVLPALPAEALIRPTPGGGYRCERLLAVFSPGEALAGEEWSLLVGPEAARQLGSR